MKAVPVLTNLRQEVLELPSVLHETLSKGRPEFEALIRRTRWGEGPVYVIGCGSAAIAGQAGARAFEMYLGRPVITRDPVDFRAYSLGVLQPRSVLLAISNEGSRDEMLESAHAARKRRATILVLGGDPESELVGMADGLFLIRSGQQQEGGTKFGVCLQAVLAYISLVSAHILRRPDPQVQELLHEFEGLPQQAEWVLNQLRDGIRSFASESRTATRLYVTGAGFYRDAARQWTCLLPGLATRGVELMDPPGSGQQRRPIADGEAAVILLSGSHCRLKRKVHEAAKLWHEAGLRILAITDGNERELLNVSRLTILLPVLSEMAGSMLSLIGLASAAAHGMRPEA